MLLRNRRTLLWPWPAVVLAMCILAFASPARAANPLVTPAWLAGHLQDNDLVVLDLRTAAEQAAGHVPGAVGAPYWTTGWQVPRPGGAAGALPPPDRIGATISALGIGDADDVVIVADDFPAAARVYWTFKVLGHTEVSILDGGWRVWRGPVETGAAATRPKATFTPRYDARLRAELPAVAAAAGAGASALVDARPPAQFKAGHLPGAIPVDQRTLYAPDGTLRPPEGLAAAVGNRAAIAYCNSGYLAAADWFALSEILHHPARLYDGSMSEWTADPSRPVVR
jgi:thiosulfate/3-mercaptopyruvate sulfurtransferase